MKKQILLFLQQKIEIQIRLFHAYGVLKDKTVENPEKLITKTFRFWLCDYIDSKPHGKRDKNGYSILIENGN
jgi:hypothetical protein